MAIDTIIVTKTSVVQDQTDEYTVTLNLTCEESAVEVINRDFSISYHTGQDVEVKVKTLENEMQAAIDQWNAEQVLFDHTKLDSAVTYLNTNLSAT